MGDGMLYLSQLVLNPRSPQAQRDLSDCHALHQRVLCAFPDAPDVTAARDHYGVLFRVESPDRLDGRVRLLVQSRERPDWSRLPGEYLRAPAPEPKRIDERYAMLVAGQELVFRLRANPTKRIGGHKADEPERWRGRRVEVIDEEGQIAWLRRKGEAAGFALLVARTWPDASEATGRSDVRVSNGVGKVTGQRSGRRLTFGAVIFEGRLRVTNADRFREALTSGIGSGKAFGFGLISVAPAPVTSAM